MSGQAPPDDDALRAMLEARARRATFERPDVRAIVAAAGPRVRRPLLEWGLGPRLGWAGGAAALIVAVAVISARPPFAQQSAGPPSTAASSSTDTGTPATTPVPTTRPALAPLRRLNSAEAGQLIRSASAARAGVLFAVDGRIEAGVTATCTSGPCGSAILAGAGGGFIVRPVGDVGPGPWNGSGPELGGTFVLRLSGAIEGDLPVVEFVGLLTAPPMGGPTWYVQDILDGSVSKEGAYAAVRGWLVRDPLHPCGSDPRNPPVSYGCPTDDWLSEDEYQPLQPDGSSLGPPAAIGLSSGSYDRWAPAPAAGGPGPGGVAPRQATYLMRLVSDGCNDVSFRTADCMPPPPRWRIVGRFDPIPDPSAVPASPDPIHTADGRVPPPDGDAWTVVQLRLRPLGDGTFVVRGWLVATPALPCLQRVAPAGEQDYSCIELDWLTDLAFQPWVAGGSNGTSRDPVVGIRVQNGAYATFAPSAASGASRALTPRFGDWLVRETTGWTCTAGGRTPPPGCLGGVTFQWEVIARLP